MKIDYNIVCNFFFNLITIKTKYYSGRSIITYINLTFLKNKQNEYTLH